MDLAGRFRRHLSQELGRRQLQQVKAHAAAELDAIGVIAVGPGQQVVFDEELNFAALGRTFERQGALCRHRKQGQHEEQAKHGAS